MHLICGHPTHSLHSVRVQRRFTKIIILHHESCRIMGRFKWHILCPATGASNHILFLHILIVLSYFHCMCYEFFEWKWKQIFRTSHYVIDLDIQEYIIVVCHVTIYFLLYKACHKSTPWLSSEYLNFSKLPYNLHFIVMISTFENHYMLNLI